MSKKYQILVEAIIAQNEEQKKSFEKSLSSQTFKDLTLKISKVQLDENAVISLQKQIQDILKNAGFDLTKLDKLKKNIENATAEGLSKGAATGANSVYKQVETALFKAGESFNPIKNQLNQGYEISGVKAVYDEKDTALLKGYNVELQKTAGNIRTISTNFVAADAESNRLFGDMVSQGKSSNQILNQVTASAGEAAQKFSALQGLISQGYKVTSTTEKFGIDAEGNSVLEGYNVQLERVNGNLKEIATGYVGVDEEGGEFLKGIKATGKEVTDVSSKVANYSETLNQLKSHHAEAFKNKDVQRYAQDLENTISAFGKGTKTVDDVALSTKKLTGEIRTVEKGFRTATTATNDFSSGLKTAINKIIMWGIGTSVVYGALRNFKEAIQYIRDLNKELINIQVVTGQNATSIKALAKEYNNLASEMGSTTIEVARGALTFIRQGKSAEESATLLKNSLMMAKLAAMETSEASDYLTSIMNGFQLSVGETTSAVDKLVAVDNAAATSVAELAEALSRSSSVAQQAGVSYENLVAYAGTISSVTRRSAESIGEALKTVFTRMENIKLGNLDDEGSSINDVEKALARVDIQIRDSEKSFRNMDDVLADVAERWNTFDEVTKASITSALAGTRQANIIVSLLNNWEMAQKLVNEQMESAGLATQRYQIYMDSAEAATNRFTAAWEKLAASTMTSDLIIGITDFGTSVLKLADDVGVLTIAIVAFITMMSKGLISELIIKGFQLLGAQIILATAETGALTVAVGGATVAFTTFQAVTGAIVFTALIIGISELVKWIDKANVSMIEFRDTFIESGDTFENNMTELDGLINRYRQLSEQTELSLDDQSELLDIVTVLNTKYGLAAEGVDLYTVALKGNNDKQKEAIELLKEVQELEANEFLLKNKSAIQNAKKWMEEGQDITFKNPYANVYQGVSGKPSEILDQLAQLASKEEDINGIYHQQYESMKEQIGAYQEIIDKAKYYSEIIKKVFNVTDAELGFKESSLSNIENWKRLIESFSEVDTSGVEAETKSFNELSSAIQDALGLYESYIENQELSVSQIFNIIENYENYTELLTIENGQITLNTQALRNNTIQKIEDALATAILQRKEGEYNAELEKQISILDALKTQVIDDFDAIAEARANETAEAAKAQVAEIQAKAAEIKEQAYQDLLQITIDMLRQKKQAEIDALQAQLDSYKAIIDAEKELIQQKEKEREYDKEKAERNKSIASLESELLELQFDDSEEGTAKRLALEEQLAEEKDDLSEFEHDRSIELQEDALDTEYEKYEKIINKKIKKLEQYLEETGTITQDAIALLSSRSDKFYQSLIEWNRQFGSGVDEDIVGAWQRAFNAMVAYAQAAQQLGVGDGITIGDLGGEGTGDQGDLSGERVKINSKDGDMVTGYQTSGGTSVETQLKEGRYYTVAEYKSGANAAYRIKGYDEDNNAIDTWIKSKNIIFETYHSGLEKGAVGGASNQYGEVFAKLLKGEFVINPQQIKDYVTTIFPKTVKAVASGGAGGITIGSIMPITVEGNLDSSVVPEIKDLAKQVQKEVYEMLKKRGIFRNANSYTL